MIASDRPFAIKPGLLIVRTYYAQNGDGRERGRGNVVAMIRPSGVRSPSVRYSAYGRPFHVQAADYTGDGSVDLLDLLAFNADWSANLGVYAGPADYTMDGVCDLTDLLFFNAEHSNTLGITTGRDVLSRSAAVSEGGNRKGYAAYEHEPWNANWQLARHRMYRADLGVWMRRDPLGYVDGMSVYAYCSNEPLTYVDPLGESRWACMGCLACLGAAGISCSVLCTDDYWDEPDVSFWSCFLKCIQAIPEAAKLVTTICGASCEGCISRGARPVVPKRPGINPAPKPTPPGKAPGKPPGGGPKDPKKPGRSGCDIALQILKRQCSGHEECAIMLEGDPPSNNPADCMKYMDRASNWSLRTTAWQVVKRKCERHRWLEGYPQESDAIRESGSCMRNYLICTGLYPDTPPKNLQLSTSVGGHQSTFTQNGNCCHSNTVGPE